MSRDSSTLGSDKVSDILTAAQELFGQVGYNKTSVREIAERANVAIGTVYAHFGGGKFGVLEAALEDLFRRVLAYTLDSPSSDPVEQFFERTRRLNRLLVRDPLLRRLHSEGGRLPEPRLRELGRDIEGRFHRMAVCRLRELEAEGLIRCEDPEAVSDLLRVSTQGWLQAHHDGRELVPHDRVLDTLLGGIRALITVSTTAEG